MESQRSGLKIRVQIIDPSLWAEITGQDQFGASRPAAFGGKGPGLSSSGAAASSATAANPAAELVQQAGALRRVRLRLQGVAPMQRPTSRPGSAGPGSFMDSELPDFVGQQRKRSGSRPTSRAQSPTHANGWAASSFDESRTRHGTAHAFGDGMGGGGGAGGMLDGVGGPSAAQRARAAAAAAETERLVAEMGEAANYLKEKRDEKASHKAQQVINPKQFWALIDEYLAPPPPADLPVLPPPPPVPAANSHKARPPPPAVPAAAAAMPRPAAPEGPSAAAIAPHAAAVLYGPCPVYDRLLASLLVLPPEAPAQASASPPAAAPGAAPPTAPAAPAATSGDASGGGASGDDASGDASAPAAAGGAPSAGGAPAAAATGRSALPAHEAARERTAAIARAEVTLRSQLVSVGLLKGDEEALRSDPVVEELRRNVSRLRQLAMGNARRLVLLHQRAQAHDAAEHRRRLVQASANRITKRYQRRRQQTAPAPRPHKKRKTGAETQAELAALGGAATVATGACDAAAQTAGVAEADAEDGIDESIGQD